MNEKSKQEAEESADKWIKWAIDHKSLTYWNSFVEGYLASAKPREKEIKSLGKRCLQLQKDKGNLTDRISDLEEKLANADYQLEGRDNEIRELEAQIKEMKCCGNCAKRGHICVAEEMQGKLCGKNKDKWELRR